MAWANWLAEFDTQRWGLDDAGPARRRIRQKSSTRRMDAHENAANDFSVVTRPAQNNDTQVWMRQIVGSVLNIRQKSSGRFMDAHEDDNNDFAAVTRPAQNNDSQLWIVVATGDGSYTMRQLRNGRFLDAHELAANDFGVVTRTAQDNDTQRWLFDFVG
jgi:protease II